MEEITVLCRVQVVLSLFVPIAIGRERGKSGQHRAPYFLTGRVLIGNGQYTASATENIPSDPISIGMDKGEKVG
jgi:hypothetical protein